MYVFYVAMILTLAQKVAYLRNEVQIFFLVVFFGICILTKHLQRFYGIAHEFHMTLKSAKPIKVIVTQPK